MKKYIFAMTIALSFSSFAFADEPDTEDHYDGQYIITDCLTVHRIPANSTDEEAIFWLDYWTEQDCN